MILPRYSSYSRSGLTLIEVIASLLIISLIIVGSVRALHLHLEQVSISRAKSNAVKAADDLLRSWSEATPFSVPANARGNITFNDNSASPPDQFRWQTRIVARCLERTELSTVRLELFRDSPLVNTALPPESDSSTLPLVTVDLVTYVGGVDLPN